MAGVAVELDSRDLAALGQALRRASKAKLRPLLDDIAGAGESATRGRIREGGPAPDGAPWPERRPGYDNPRNLLNFHGGLLDSIDSEASEQAAVWGSSLVYARIHQLGGTIVPRNARALAFDLGGDLVLARSVTLPARPYLGYGEDERRGVEDMIELWLEELLGGR